MAIDTHAELPTDARHLGATLVDHESLYHHANLTAQVFELEGDMVVSLLAGNLSIVAFFDPFLALQYVQPELHRFDAPLTRSFDVHRCLSWEATWWRPRWRTT